MSRLFMFLSLAACVVLASCAASTMDSIPTGAQMQIYKQQAQREMGSEYTRLAELRHSNVLSEAEYQAELSKLDDRVVARAHTLAWEQHNLAELERKAQGVPTPDQPVQLMAPNAMNGGAGGQSLYRNYQQQYNITAGVGGSNMLGSSIMGSTSSSGGGGALGRQNFPGTVYDAPTVNQ
ncbi:MAG: hypothetical protein JNN17_23335 [Verrucomicrobiaceae bacterium]|nr:hypothetical protein [Verrucomicrobiaceae bacterium]